MKQSTSVELVPGCDHEFEAESEEEILRHIELRTRQGHGMPEVPPEVMDQVRAMLVAR